MKKCYDKKTLELKGYSFNGAFYFVFIGSYEDLLSSGLSSDDLSSFVYSPREFHQRYFLELQISLFE